MKAKAETLLAKAFDGKLADAVKSITFIDRKAGTYDPSTGGVTGVETQYVSRGVISQYTDLEIANSDGIIDINDLKLLVLAQDVDVVPETNFKVLYNSVEYKVTEVRIDPIQVSYTIRMR